MIDNGWDDEWDEPRHRRPPWVLLFLVGIVVLAGLGFAGYEVYRRQRPTYAVQTWINAVWDIKSETVLARTCDDQAEFSNAIASVASLRGLIDYLDIAVLAGIQGALAELSLDIAVDQLGDQFEVDWSNIAYVEELIDEETAVVIVTGQVKIRIFDGWYPYRLNERWLVIREDDRWKWCGQQL